jgi:hypothetical protein
MGDRCLTETAKSGIIFQFCAIKVSVIGKEKTN